MTDPLEQRYAVKFCVLLGKNTVETNEMIKQAFKDKALSESSVRKWHKMFRDGREEVTDEARSGRPSTSRTDENVDRVRQLLNEDRRQGVRLIAQTLNIAKSTVHRIVTEELHIAFFVSKYLAKAGVPLVPQPPYSPDVAPADFFLFPSIKSKLKGKHWGTIKDIQEATTRALKDLPVDVFQGAFRAWKTRLQKCIDAEGCYFEEY
ncbi:protein GVQW3-like [Hyposmocoma kahamanoa]|uniref:protein GVQW3-like n=1 Tax=Hyposmocoma kahamanoa TaxID=1477025 RepID=UPI000E6D948B|nr:protein GVQW3-like [Hyposmocoma kahamanoa]